MALFIMYGALDFLVGNLHCKHNQNYSGSSLSNNLLHSDSCTKGLRPFSAGLNILLNIHIIYNTMKALLLALVLTTPAIAQSIDPIAYGQRYCLLRKLNIDSATARKAAVEYSYDTHRSLVNSKEDISAAAKYTIKNCPDF